MATTAIQKRTRVRYEAAKVTRKVVKFYPGHEDLLAHLEKQQRQNAYIIEPTCEDPRAQCVSPLIEAPAPYHSDPPL